MAKFLIKQDHEGCISCGACVAVCPSNWEFGKDGKAKPKKATDSNPCNLEAEKVCPVNVIHVKEIK